MTRTVIVTGASGGIGRACAAVCGRLGDRVAYSREARLDCPRRPQTSNAAATGRSSSLVDVADADAVLATAKRIEAEVGLVDIWVNVAFTSVFAPLDRISGEEYRRVPRSVTSATCRHLETAVTLTHSHRLRRSSA
jgi:NAD(P)-dependent dehydrogenase (short-subunit alcohol dehydrogenase family)